eukprot:g7569.t1
MMLWGLAILLVYLIQNTQKDATPFDPFEILGIQSGATSSEIRKAYFELSKIYHPDKNPDPKAHRFFAEKISKAYQALTDPVSKENYEKHGHPDGPQGIDLGIALPEWLFTKDPRALLLLVVVFILLPMSIMAYYLFRSDKYTGPNSIMQETLEYYTFSKHKVKESQGIVRIPETLVVAKEFITLYTPNDQGEAFDELRKLILSFYPELKSKNQFWKRRASVVKAHMLLYAHLERAHDQVPTALNSDLKFVLEKSIPLLQEIFKIACFPRAPIGHGWMTPAVSAIQVMQCVTQAVPLTVRRAQTNKRAITEGFAALLQLPGMSMSLARTLEKKKIKSVHDLAELEDSERIQILHSLDFDTNALHEVDTALQALPMVEMKAKIFVEEEEEIREGDTVTCRVQLLLRRRSHESGEVSEEDLSGAGALCFCSNYPFSRPEKWYIMVAVPGTSRVICWKHVVLKEAEKSALVMSKSTGLTPTLEGQDEDIGQIVEMKFPAVKEGTYDVIVACYSDCWIGVDKIIPMKFVVKKAAKFKPVVRLTADHGSSDDDQSEEVEPEGDKYEAPDSEASQEGEEDIDDDDEDDYDSEESGELETGTDEEEEEVEKNKND